MTGKAKIRKKRDTHKKRQTILDGAVKVFIESGYDVSSMDKIAEVDPSKSIGHALQNESKSKKPAPDHP